MHGALGLKFENLDSKTWVSLNTWTEFW
jgi:hypothetical protein